MVFVDPVGTGHSRPSKPEYEADLYQTPGDAEAMAEFIRVFTGRFETWEQPLFIVGGPAPPRMDLDLDPSFEPALGYFLVEIHATKGTQRCSHPQINPSVQDPGPAESPPVPDG